MKRKRDKVYQAVIAEIERVGGTIDSERQGNGSHRVVYWSLGERQFHNTIARDAGGWRAPRNAVAEVRAKLRGIR